MTSQLTEATIRALPTPAKGNRITYFPEAARTGKAPVGFAVRVTAAGARSFLLCYRDAAGDHRATIGRVGAMSLSGAIREASQMRLAIDGGEVIAVKRGGRAPAAEAQAAPVTVADVIDDWTKRVGRDLRTLEHYEGAFQRYVRPALGNLPVASLTKAPIRDMVDDIRDSAGPRMANKTLGY